MAEYVWMWLNQQQYALNPKYDKIMNMVKFSICERSTAISICQNCLERVLNIFWVLNIPGFWILHRVLNMPKYGTWICRICMNVQ